MKQNNCNPNAYDNIVGANQTNTMPNPFLQQNYRQQSENINYSSFGNSIYVHNNDSDITGRVVAPANVIQIAATQTKRSTSAPPRIRRTDSLNNSKNVANCLDDTLPISTDISNKSIIKPIYKWAASTLSDYIQQKQSISNNSNAIKCNSPKVREMGSGVMQLNEVNVARQSIKSLGEIAGVIPNNNYFSLRKLGHCNNTTTVQNILQGNTVANLISHSNLKG